MELNSKSEKLQFITDAIQNIENQLANIKAGLEDVAEEVTHIAVNLPESTN